MPKSLLDWVWLFAIGFVFLFPSLAWSAPLTYQQEVMIYAVAYGEYGRAHGGISRPAPPAVRFDTKANMCAAFGRGPDCPAGGYFSDGEIVMADDLDFSKKFDASKLLHEMVHYLQWAHKGPTLNCEMFMDREREAYGIQHYVLLKEGEYQAAQIVRMSMRIQQCSDARKVM